VGSFFGAARNWIRRTKSPTLPFPKSGGIVIASKIGHLRLSDAHGPPIAQRTPMIERNESEDVDELIRRGSPQPGPIPGRSAILRSFCLSCFFAFLIGLAFPMVGTAQVFNEWVLPSGSSPARIAAGPDGALWFTESDGNRIGRITITGIITEFSIPTGGSSPTGIAAGADGALWFTEYNGNNIGRITTSGTITEYPDPYCGCVSVPGTHLSMPSAILAAPNGGKALWFVEAGENAIGQISLSGSPSNARLHRKPIATLSKR
jgi:hypothetical protein